MPSLPNQEKGAAQVPALLHSLRAEAHCGQNRSHNPCATCFPHFPRTATTSASSTEAVCTASNPHAASSILRMLPYLKHRNANGAHIYFRPTGESEYTLLDDLTAADTLAQACRRRLQPPPPSSLKPAPAASRHGYATRSRFPKSLEPSPPRTLAAQFGADTGAADWRRFGRAPGFHQPQAAAPQRRRPLPLRPSHQLIPASRSPLAATVPLTATDAHAARRAEQERAAAPSPLRSPGPSALAFPDRVVSLPCTSFALRRSASRRRYGFLHRSRDAQGWT